MPRTDNDPDEVRGETPWTGYIPIMKIDQERHEVWGWGAVEEPDNSHEIMDYASSRPNFMNMSSQAEKRSGGKSKGAVRAMHEPIAAGKLIDLRAVDAQKGFYIGAKVVDDNEWKKVEQGVYTGFSVGGSYERRWPDPMNPGLIRYTAKPVEFSLVDVPCVPSATFQFVKADGVTLRAHFAASKGDRTMLPLEKAIPDSPGSNGQFETNQPPMEGVDALKPMETNVVRMPDPFSTMELNPAQDPGAETLAPKHFAAGNSQQELTTQVGELKKAVLDLTNIVLGLKKVVEDAVYYDEEEGAPEGEDQPEEEADAEPEPEEKDKPEEVKKFETPSPQSGRMIPVTKSHYVKVKEN